MRTGFARFSSRLDERIVQAVEPLRHPGLKYAWMVLAAFVCLGAFGEIEPEAAEAVNSVFGIGGIACVLWGIWQLMQYDG
jgi:hypothetical protein